MAQRDDDPTTAIATYQQALDLPMEPRLNLGARLNLAVLLMETDQLEEAIKLTTTATEHSPQGPQGWPDFKLFSFPLSLASHSAGQKKEAPTAELCHKI